MIRSPRAAAATRFVGWSVVAGGATSLAAALAGRRARPLGIIGIAAQAALPWSALVALPVAAIGTFGRARRARLRAMPVAAAVVGTAGIVVAAHMAGPPPFAPPAMPGTGADRLLRVAHVNLLFINRKHDGGAEVLEALDADVLAFSEYTPVLAVALEAGLADRYPHRIDRAGPKSHGAALWSRFPVTERAAAPMRHERVTADVATPGGETVRVLVVHPVSPPHKLASWRTDMAILAADVPPAAVPAVMIGDFNATWLHPELRSIVAAGWHSAHRQRGRGLVPSWPANRLYPPYLRIDHALVNDRAAVLDVADFTFPGSDHRGLVVTMGRVPPAAP